MDFRQVTPPSAFDLDDFDAFQCPGGSASTNETFFLNEWSPESIMTAGTAATTPPKSPQMTREIGPTLLPRVRAQDQMVNSTLSIPARGHNRAVSLPASAFQMQLGGYLPMESVEGRRSASPPVMGPLPTPLSASLPYEHLMQDQASCRSSISNTRSYSSSNIHSHSRNSSVTSIDASVLGRYGFPTYRHSPGPQVRTPGCVPMSRTPSAMSHLAPIAMPGGQIQSYPARRRTASPPARPSSLATEIEFDPNLDLNDASILEYLTESNPAPALVQHVREVNNSQSPHFWFDVRNVASWSDFNVDTITAIPGLLNLLEVKVALRQLPNPGKVNLNPQTLSDLAEISANYHAAKVNAALKLSQGADKHMAMRFCRSTNGSKPEFVSNYESETERTIYGDGRGRVIGIVKSYNQWNSGMRSGSPNDKVRYLQSLAFLQQFMREHECRYGFIMTEIELVCVRAGGVPDETNIPLFGYVEVAEPVRVATHGTGDMGKIRMTVELALWYLHMLAKEQPFPGQYHWKMNVGPPAQLTRQHHLPRDSWMPKPASHEQRPAKRHRGWLWPGEPLSRKECGRGRRNNRG